MTLTRAQIMELIAEQNSFARNESTEVVENLVQVIKYTLENGEDVLISGFGKLCLKEKG